MHLVTLAISPFFYKPRANLSSGGPSGASASPVWGVTSLTSTSYQPVRTSSRAHHPFPATSAEHQALQSHIPSIISSVSLYFLT